MTEHQWLNSIDVAMMLKFVRKDDRKQRLFAVACVRRFWYSLDHHCRNVVEIAEQFADGQVPYCEVVAARLVLDGFHGDLTEAAWYTASVYQEHYYMRCASLLCASVAKKFEKEQSKFLRDVLYPFEEETRQANLFRDIFNPFYKPNVKPDATALNIANEIYQHKTFDELPVLADALEDSDCNDEPLITHLRSQLIHVKGCWALDTVLGKT